MYNYHRRGFDLLESNLEGARLNIADALIEMRSTNRIRPGSFNLQVFFLAKSDEIIKLFSPAPEAERVRPSSYIKTDGSRKHLEIRRCSTLSVKCSLVYT